MIFIVLPAYNEAENVETLLRDTEQVTRELLPNSDFCTVLVNDGSTDDTGGLGLKVKAELSSRQSRFTLEVISHPVNRGLADAIKTGLLFCCDKAQRGDVIVTMDCDNSHTPGLVPRLTRRIYEGYDVVIASRYTAGAKVVGLSRFRKILSFFASKLFMLTFPIPGVRDYTCGFRAYRAELLVEVFRRYPQFISEKGFSVMIDILLKLHQHDPKLAFGEVPLLLRYDRKAGASKMNVRKTTLETLALLLRRRIGKTD